MVWLVVRDNQQKPLVAVTLQKVDRAVVISAFSSGSRFQARLRERRRVSEGNSSR
jgi:hypothetical protein